MVSKIRTGWARLLPGFVWAIIEKRFAKRMIRHLLDAYHNVTSDDLELSGRSLYREVLLQTQVVEPDSVDQILGMAEDSVDAWTSPGRESLGFREVVHYLVLAKYRDTGRDGSVVSFGGIVNSLVPAHL